MQMNRVSVKILINDIFLEVSLTKMCVRWKNINLDGFALREAECKIWSVASC